MKSKIEELLVKRPSYNMMVDSGILKVTPFFPLSCFLLNLFLRRNGAAKESHRGATWSKNSRTSPGEGHHSCCPPTMNGTLNADRGKTLCMEHIRPSKTIKSTSPIIESTFIAKVNSSSFQEIIIFLLFCCYSPCKLSGTG